MFALNKVGVGCWIRVKFMVKVGKLTLPDFINDNSIQFYVTKAKLMIKSHTYIKKEVRNSIYINVVSNQPKYWIKWQICSGYLHPKICNGYNIKVTMQCHKLELFNKLQGTAITLYRRLQQYHKNFFMQQRRVTEDQGSFVQKLCVKHSLMVLLNV